MNILIVEDNQILNRIFKNFINNIKEMHLNVFIKENGKEALDFINFSKYKMDLIFTDIQMPVMNGIEFCRKLRTVDKVTPIVVCSALHESREEEIKNIDSNIEVTCKPYDFDKLGYYIYINSKPKDHFVSKKQSIGM